MNTQRRQLQLLFYRCSEVFNQSVRYSQYYVLLLIQLNYDINLTDALNCTSGDFCLVGSS